MKFFSAAGRCLRRPNFFRQIFGGGNKFGGSGCSAAARRSNFYYRGRNDPLAEFEKREGKTERRGEKKGGEGGTGEGRGVGREREREREREEEGE